MSPVVVGPGRKASDVGGTVPIAVVDNPPTGGYFVGEHLGVSANGVNGATIVPW